MIRCRPHRQLDLPIELVQVDEDPTLGHPAEREIRYDTGARAYRSGGWREHKGGLEIGIYCAHCLQEGSRTPLDADRLDLDDAGVVTEPLIFKDAAAFSIDKVWPDLEAKFGDAIQSVRDEEARPAVFAPLPAALSPAVANALARKFNTPEPRLYSHQAQAVSLTLAGSDVVIETPTASGKSLVYTLPILNAVLEDPSATALYISPLNALSEDQLESFTEYDESGTDWERAAKDNPLAAYLREIRVSGHQIRLARYDGEVDKAYRAPVRDSVPNVLVTNPDMLHAGILAFHERWKPFLSQLRYVVIDELHIYRGIFGAHVANVLRRLRRICESLGASPQFISCSATIHNPVELAELITGRRPALVGKEADGSEKRRRRFALWDAGRTDDVINTEAKNLMLELMATHRVKSIAFMRSIPGVRALDQYMREDLEERLHNKERLIEPYFRALPPADKRKITQDLQSGKLQGVVSTTALQMGIDIGELSAALLVKYPGSMSSVWQQAGRVGRKGEGLIFLLLDKDPLNQFFARHPDQFFAMGAEEVYVDPDNSYVTLDHLCCAARELPLRLDHDAAYWGQDMQQAAEKLLTAGKLKRDAGGLYSLADEGWNPAHDIQLRGVGFEFPVYHGRDEILREDSVRAPRSLHKYARFTHKDHVMEVTDFEMDVDARKGSARVRKLSGPEANFVTVPLSEYETLILTSDSARDALGLDVRFGMIQLSSQVTGYYKVPASAKQLHEKPLFQHLGKAAPPRQSYSARALWFTLHPQLFRGMNEQDLAAGVRSMQKALALAACVELRADLADVAGLELLTGEDGLPVLFVYDTMPGGSGLSEKAFDRFDRVLRTAHTILADCPYCSIHPESRGCARCVSEEWGVAESIDRRAALLLLDAILTVGDRS